MSDEEVDDMLQSNKHSGVNAVVKHRGKLLSIPHNARCCLALQAEGGSSALTELLWSFVGGKVKLNSWVSASEIPSRTVESDQMSQALKKLGFKFVGPTTCYSLMQSCGLVAKQPSPMRISFSIGCALGGGPSKAH